MVISPAWLDSLVAADGARRSASMTFRPLTAPGAPAEAPPERPAPVAAPSDHPPTLTLGGDGAPAPPRTGTDSGLRRLRDVLDVPGDLAGRPYVLVGRIGAGGMGVVHLARQRATGREVAIKAIRPELAGSAMHDYFRAECRVTANLEHPSIPPVYDAGDDFMVLKRLAGSCLEDRLESGAAEGGGLIEVVEALLSVCDALAFAHSRGVIHRDIKGDNILVGSFGQVWLMDWGLAVAVRPGEDGRWHSQRLRSRAQACAGTPMCIAPEVASGEVQCIGPATDLFTLGALLYRVLSGMYPFHSFDSRRSLEMAARGAHMPLVKLVPSAPFRLMQAAERTLAWTPEDRGTLAAFADDLRTWVRSSGATTRATYLVEEAAQELARCSGALSPEDSYGRYSRAIAACEQAIGLCPELRAARQVLGQAREGFSRAALASGDLLLARMVSAGFVPERRPG
jgi:serine/threonine protein kinase